MERLRKRKRPKKIKKSDWSAALAAGCTNPGSKQRSGGRGRGLARGKGKGPMGVPFNG